MMTAKKSAPSVLFVLICTSFLFALGGCGVKPNKMEPPASVQNDTFPNVYPDTTTDPAQ